MPDEVAYSGTDVSSLTSRDGVCDGVIRVLGLKLGFSNVDGGTNVSVVVMGVLEKMARIGL